MRSDSVGIACAYRKAGGGFRSHVAEHRSRSRPATLLLPVTLQFTFLFRPFIIFHLLVTTVQNGLRGLGHKKGVLSCTVTSPDLSPEASGSLPLTSHTFRSFRCFPTPSDVFCTFRRLPQLPRAFQCLPQSSDTYLFFMQEVRFS